jgi:beta-glucanase (GH16 family)
MGVTQGYVEARLKSPRGVGFWPAFWLLPANCDPNSGYTTLGWPECGEIDIYEGRGGNEGRAGQTVHYGMTEANSHWSASGGASNISPDTAADYHTYGVGWKGSGISGELKFYFDGNVTATVDFPRPQWNDDAEKTQRINQTFFNDIPWIILINLAVSGNYVGGAVPSDSVFTSSDWESRSLMVDWVRVYERVNENE